MNSPSITPVQTSRAAGRAPVAVLGALLAVVGVGVLAGVAVMSRGGGGKAAEPTVMTQAQIDAELGALQEAFQSALQEKEDLTRLRAKAKRLTERAPKEPAAHVLLAQLQMGSQRWAKAYASWQRAVELDPGGYELWKMAGFSAAKLGRLDEARAHYTQATQIQGGRTDCEVYNSLGRLGLAMGDTPGAERAFTAALSAPGIGEHTNWKHEAYAGLADVQSVRGEHAKAHELIDRAIRLASSDSSADRVGYHIQKARLYLDAGEHDQALTMLTHTWREHPAAQQRIESAALRARLYELAGELDRAVNHLTYLCQTYQIDPQRKDTELANRYALLAKWQIKAGQSQEAKTSLHNLATLAPGHRELDALRAALE